MKKLIGGSLGAVLTALVGSPMPEMPVRIFYVLIFFICLDIVGGLYLAGVQGRIASNTLHTKTKTKLVQFSMIVGVGLGACTIAQNWIPVGMCFGGLIGTEFVSILETLVSLQKYGVSLKYMQPFLTFAKRVLAVGTEDSKETTPTDV